MKVALLFPCLLFALQTVAWAGTPITRDRAHELAAYYFARFFPREGCGGPTVPVREGNAWVSTVRIGYSGVPHGTVRIEQQTGRVSYQGPYLLKPSVSAAGLDRWAARLNPARR